MGANIWTTESGWRELRKTIGGNSSGNYLNAPDTSNIITVGTNASNATTLVMMDYEGHSIGSACTGLYISNKCSGTELSYCIGSFCSTSYAGYVYATEEVGGQSTAFLGNEDAKYGGIRAYAVHIPVPGWRAYEVLTSRIYPGACINADNSTTNYFRSSYKVQQGATCSWLSYSDVKGHTFAAITMEYEPNQRWIPLAFWLEKNVKYTFYLQSYTGNDYEGLVLYDTQKSTDPGTDSNKLSGLPTANKCTYVSNGITTYTVTPSTAKYYYIYMRTRSNQGSHARYGSVKVVKHVNITLSGNGNGSTNTLTLPVYTAFSNAVTTSMTRYGTSGVNYGFLGFYNTSAGSTQMIDTSGILVTPNKMIETTASTSTWYAWWRNTISYSMDKITATDWNNRYMFMWCTNSAESATKTTTNSSKQISTSGIKCASGGTVSLSLRYGNYEGFTIDSSAKYLIAPSGISSGWNYHTTGQIYASSPSGTNYESATTYYSEMPSVNFSAVTFSTFENPVITTSQKKDIPASGVTISSGNISTYFNYSASQKAKFTNGAGTTTSVSPVSVGGSMSCGSLGIDYDFGDYHNYGGSGTLTLTASSNGKTGSKTITQARYEQNKVEEVILSTYPYFYDPDRLSINVDDSFRLYIGAKYTSNSVRDLVYDGPEYSLFFFFSIPWFCYTSFTFSMYW